MSDNPLNNPILIIERTSDNPNEVVAPADPSVFDLSRAAEGALDQEVTNAQNNTMGAIMTNDIGTTGETFKPRGHTIELHESPNPNPAPALLAQTPEKEGPFDEAKFSRILRQKLVALIVTESAKHVDIQKPNWIKRLSSFLKKESIDQPRPVGLEENDKSREIAILIRKTLLEHPSSKGIILMIVENIFIKQYKILQNRGAQSPEFFNTYHRDLLNLTAKVLQESDEEVTPNKGQATKQTLAIFLTETALKDILK